MRGRGGGRRVGRPGRAGARCVGGNGGGLKARPPPERGGLKARPTGTQGRWAESPPHRNAQRTRTPPAEAGGVPGESWASVPETQRSGRPQAALRRELVREFVLKFGKLNLPVLLFQPVLPVQVGFFQFFLAAVVLRALLVLVDLRPEVRRALDFLAVVRLAVVLNEVLVRLVVPAFRVFFLKERLVRLLGDFRALVFLGLFVRVELLGDDLVQDLFLRVGLRLLLEGECLRALVVLPHFLFLRVVLENFLLVRVLVVIARGS